MMILQEFDEQKLQLDEATQRIRELVRVKTQLEAAVRVSQTRRKELETELDAGLLDECDAARTAVKVGGPQLR